MENPICSLCNEIISNLETQKKIFECYKCHSKIHYSCGMEARIFERIELKVDNLEWGCPKCINSLQSLNSFCFLCNEQHGILLESSSKLFKYYKKLLSIFFLEEKK